MWTPLPLTATQTHNYRWDYVWSDYLLTADVDWSLESLGNSRIQFDHEIILRCDHIVALLDHLGYPFSKGIANKCVDHIGNPLSWQLAYVTLIGHMALNLFILQTPCQHRLYCETLITRYMKVFHIIGQNDYTDTLNKFLSDTYISLHLESNPCRNRSKHSPRAVDTPMHRSGGTRSLHISSETCLRTPKWLWKSFRLIEPSLLNLKFTSCFQSESRDWVVFSD